MRHLIALSVSALLSASLLAPLAAAASAPVVSVTKQSDGVVLTTRPGVLRLQVFSDGAIRVTYVPTSQLPDLHSFTVIAKPAATHWTLHEDPDAVSLDTALLRASVDRRTGAVSFLTPDGKPLLRESPDGKDIPGATAAASSSSTGPASTEPASLPPPVAQSFLLPSDEGIYGLGQHQQGLFNYRGHTVRLLQRNTEVAIPVLLSSHGYVLLWDNPAVTDVSVGAPLTPPATSSAPHAKPGTPPPPAGFGPDLLRWSSETGQAIDYYFCYGPTPDASMRQYRALSGNAPLMPEWAWGFFQSKERYRTGEELLSVARQYRQLNVPIDGIIQDWRYWPDGAWGSHSFDKSRYPDPAATFKELHDLGYHVLISVWPKFDLGTSNIQQLEAAGAMYDPVIPYVYPPGRGKWYDPFNPKGRSLYWKQLSSELFSLGVDGWWLDASEAELSGKWGEFRSFRTALGPGATVFNAYPLMHSSAVYQGQRADTSDKRVVILTRSAYAGQQRNSAITWSGDITGTWQVLHNQVPAGLNFSASGIPYWNTDIGGFFGNRSTGNMDPADPRYQELFARWFEFGSFCPMFRVHGSAPQGGTGPGKEFWRFDPATQAIWRTYVDLRYRLLPYIYSVSWAVTHDGSSMMRPLVMDFAGDPRVLNIGDQYLFGPSLMVNPVTTEGATSRSVYLPAHPGGWFDFWTGGHHPSSTTVDAAAPVETVPLFVPAGSILPLGPLVQHVGEKPADPIELRVYPGADGSFTLYEDAGDGYQYESGQFSTIPLSWSDATRTLTVGDRQGSFPGMLPARSFHVTFVRDGHGAGPDSSTPDVTLHYDGRHLSTHAP